MCVCFFVDLVYGLSVGVCLVVYRLTLFDGGGCASGLVGWLGCVFLFVVVLGVCVVAC